MSDEQVSQFMSFTGSAEPAQAASYLEMSGGVLDMAVSLYMEHNSGGGGAGGGFGGMGGGGAAHDAGGAAAAMPPHDVRAPDATRTMRLMDDDVGPHPAYQIMNAMMDEQLAQSAFASSPVGRNANARDVVNAAAAAETKRDDDDDEYEYASDADDNGDEDDDDEVEVVEGSAPPAPARLADMFAQPDHIMHKAGGFQGARSSAKDSKRWLLVNLQRDSEFSCHALNRDVWRDELVENLVREGFIFWQAVRMLVATRSCRTVMPLRAYQCRAELVLMLCFAIAFVSVRLDGCEYRRSNLFGTLPSTRFPPPCNHRSSHWSAVVA